MLTVCSEPPRYECVYRAGALVTIITTPGAKPELAHSISAVDPTYDTSGEPWNIQCRDKLHQQSFPGAVSHNAIAPTTLPKPDTPGQTHGGAQ